MSEPDWIKQEINGLKESGPYTCVRTIGSPQGAWLIVVRKKAMRHLLSVFRVVTIRFKEIVSRCNVSHRVEGE